MQIKIYRVLFVACIFSILCTTPYLNAQDYYPLEIGNRWDYQRTYHSWPSPPELDTFTVKVIGDSLFPNGEKYYVLNQWDLGVGKYVRADSNFIFYYNSNDAVEDTVFRLNASPREEWTIELGSLLIRLDSIWTYQLFGFTTTLLSYRLDGLVLGYTTLSDKFGPIFSSSPGEPPGTSSTSILLIGCILDSVEYGEPVMVEEKIFNQPLDFSLSQNYPNPFNPTTKIKFTIPSVTLRLAQSDVFVTLKVYDVLGNEIAILVNEEKPPETYEVEFSTGLIHQTIKHTLPSGIYFYQLRSGEYIESKKMILLK